MRGEGRWVRRRVVRGEEIWGGGLGFVAVCMVWCGLG